MKIKIFCDGGSRGNPGIAGAGSVLFDIQGKIIEEIAQYLGNDLTNNVAEYHSLINGLEAAARRGATEVEVYMDSNLVVKQMNGEWKIKHPDMKEKALDALRIAQKFHKVSYEWIPRERNSLADSLANKAMNEKKTTRISHDTVVEEKKAAKVEAQALPGYPYSLTLFIVRHGQTDMVRDNKLSGSGSDVGINDQGREEVHRAAQYIRDHRLNHGRITTVISSPMLRCQESAFSIARTLGCEISTDARLAEISFGEWEGRTSKELMETEPLSYVSFISSADVAAPGGESAKDLFKRVKSFKEKLVKKYPNETLVLSTHGGPAKVLLALAAGGNAENIRRFTVDTGSVSIVQFWSDGGSTIVESNGAKVV